MKNRGLARLYGNPPRDLTVTWRPSDPALVRVAEPRPARVLPPRPPIPASGVAGGEDDFPSCARFPGRSSSQSANNTLAVILALGGWSAFLDVEGVGFEPTTFGL